MDRQRRSNLVLGILLLLLGGWFLAVQLLPGLGDLINIDISWPLIVVGVGVLLFFLGLLIGAPDMAVPGTIVAGIGGILYWQNLTGNWASWAYVWTLIPGFVGIGIILSGLIGGRARASVREGGGLLIISLIMFAIFSSFLGPFVGGGAPLGRYWPVLLILVGLWLLARPWVRAR
jgi:hypothetical protein